VQQGEEVREHQRATEGEQLACRRPLCPPRHGARRARGEGGGREPGLTRQLRRHEAPEADPARRKPEADSAVDQRPAEVDEGELAKAHAALQERAGRLPEGAHEARNRKDAQHGLDVRLAEELCEGRCRHDERHRGQRAAADGKDERRARGDLDAAPMLHERSPQPRLLEEPDEAHDGHAERHDAEVRRTEETGQRDRHDEADRHAGVVHAGCPAHAGAHAVDQRPWRVRHAGLSRSLAGSATRAT
jgi:hypothetical protein